MAFLFASPIDIDVKLEGEESRKQVEIKGEKERVVSCPVYYDGDSIGGQVRWCGFSFSVF
jgi:vacuolar protein sorting-associated protein 26